MKYLTWLWKTLKWLMLTVLTCVVIVILINLKDQSPSQQALELSAPFRNVVNDRDNAYLYLLGLEAEETADPIAFGRKRLDKYNQVNLLGFKQPDGPIEPFTSDLKVNKFCDPWVDRCIQKIRSLAPGHLQAELDKHKRLLSRYQKLIQFNAFEEQLVPGLHSPFGVASYRMHSLYLANTTSNFIKGNRKQAFTALEMEIHFQRLALENARSLITKMLAVAQLHKDYRLLGEFIAETPSEELTQYADEIAKSLQFSKESLYLDHVFRYEYGFTRSITGSDAFMAMSADPDSWSNYFFTPFVSLFFKRQNSYNLTAENFSEHVSASHLTLDQWMAQQSEMQNKMGDMNRMQWHWVYNPIGKTLASVGAPAYSVYVGRVFDVYAMNRLVGAAWKIKTMKGNIAETSRQLPAEWLNPYTLKPFSWDAQDHELGFEPAGGRRSDRKFSLLLREN